MTQEILKAIELAKTREDVVPAYAKLIEKSFEGHLLAGGPVVREVNQAIVDRWSRSALSYIKRKAWERFDGVRQW